MSGKLTLILGGARSGKSRYALELVQRYDRVLFVATAQPLDDEMKIRIANHKAERPPQWRTLETPLEVGRAIAKVAKPFDVVIVDCLTLLANNVVFSGSEEEPDWSARGIQLDLEVANIIGTHQQGTADMIVVSNEVGLGIVPVYASARHYRDMLGWANQTLAAAADEVLFMVAGLPMKVK
ncbi:MAG: bifunctional adenosylcobinamide kinase/adenosylcobinamide-phosphate guanylyltransferase [Ardenticatenaceae bacterium]|nr:bifunctional adenosylcobinamide kinase/adenosylcobinamide-phosphate guanylyltransferase [Ardenticatenaceae bacterium]